MANVELTLASQILDLEVRHRELDEQIAALETYPYLDQIKIRRLKKEKLRLKDLIQRLRAQAIPDLDA